MHSLLSAQKIANRVVELLSPGCEKIHIAGSIRRQSAQVKDIEIVCQPIKELTDIGMELFKKYEISNVFKNAIDIIGLKIEKGSVDGRYMKIILLGGMTLDLFMPTADDYFRQLVIRTGSADYVYHVIASSWKQKGWCGTSDGLRLIKECTGKQTTDGKTIWRCTSLKPVLPPVWQSEEEFFSWLSLPFTPAECREIHKYTNIGR